VEERVVVGVGGHGDGVVGGGDGGGAGAGEVEEDVGKDGDEDRKGAVEQGGEERECRGNEKDLGDGEEEDEEYLEFKEVQVSYALHESSIGSCGWKRRTRTIGCGSYNK
jgi:hypothetical protein